MVLYLMQLPNVLQTVALLQTTTSGNMADGFGPVIQFAIKDNTSLDEPIGFFGMTRDGADTSGAFIFNTYNAGVSSEKVRINKSGFLGLNTNNPTSRLHAVNDVNGDSYIGIFQNLNATGGSIVQLDRGSDAGNTRATGINLTQGNTTRWFVGTPRRGGSSNSNIFTVSTTTDINAAGGEFLLNPSGNCCIGGGFAFKRFSSTSRCRK
jgi:hypothetical protein